MGESNHNRTYNIEERTIYNEPEWLLQRITQCGFVFTFKSTNERPANGKAKYESKREKWMVHSADQYIEKSLSTSTSFGINFASKKNTSKQQQATVHGNRADNLNENEWQSVRIL